ncbi:MAG: hypothetical protein ACRCZE_04420 [Candidatus Altimarinota bacterium]
MNKYSFYSEKAALEKQWQATFNLVGEKLEKAYLEEGFKAMTERLKFTQEWQKQLLFDFLVWERDVVLKCVVKHRGFFLKIIADGRGEIIRDMLGVEDRKYDLAWEKALEKLKTFFVEKEIDQKLSNLSLANFFYLAKLRRQRKLGNY